MGCGCSAWVTIRQVTKVDVSGRRSWHRCQAAGACIAACCDGSCFAGQPESFNCRQRLPCIHAAIHVAEGYNHSLLLAVGTSRFTP